MKPDASARRGRWLTPRLVLLTLTILVLGITAGVVTAMALPPVPKRYEARAEILYSSSEAQRAGSPLVQDRLLTTQLTLLKSRAVLGPVAQKQGRQFDDLQKDVDASVLARSTIIEVQVKGDNGPAVLQTLQAVIDGYLALANQPTGVILYLEKQLANAQVNTQLAQTHVTQLTTAVVAGTASQASLQDATAQLTASREQERAIQAQIDQAKLTGQAGPTAQVLTSPYSRPVSTSPKRVIAASIGPLVGLLLAGVILAIGAMRYPGVARP